jgi:putative nucleotidyltransferase with HDIG domain
MPENNSVLLVEDDQIIVKYMREKLVSEGGYAVSIAYSATEGLNLFKNGKFDLVIIAFDLPDLSGLEFLKQLKKVDPNCTVIVISENYNSRILEDASLTGVYDYISKPIDPEKLLFLSRKGIDLHGVMVQQNKTAEILKEQNSLLQKQNLLLAKRIDESTHNLTRLYEDLRSTYMRTIKALAQAIDARDHYTHSHSENVAKIAVIIAEEMGLAARDIENIRQASEMHDLGKIGVEDRILTKPSSLNAEEWEQIKRHPQMGAQILEPLTFLNEVIELVRQHHEHYGGTGYPRGLKGEEILLGAQIIHLADAYESMRSERAYRKTPFTKQEAVAEIRSKEGSQFAPKVVEVFLKVVDRI